MRKNGGSDGTRTRGLLRDWAAFRRHEVRFHVNKVPETRSLISADPRRETLLHRVKFVQRTRARP